jgi:hypothetical protein
LESLGRLGVTVVCPLVGAPVFRIGRNPAVSLFLGRKIPDMRDWAISSTYGNGPTTVLDHFRMKFGFLSHPKNTCLQQNGSIPTYRRARPVCWGGGSGATAVQAVAESIIF